MPRDGTIRGAAGYPPVQGGRVYQLQVYLPGEKHPHVTATAKRGSEVLTLIPKLLEAHDGCERIVVLLGQMRLFSVDCAGNRHD